MKLTLDGKTLDISTLWQAAQTASDPAAALTLSISDDARAHIEKAARFIEEKAASGETVYGVNTGFGFFARTKIAPEELTTLQANIIRSHSCGVGEALPRPLVMAMLLILLNSICRGHRGVRLEIVQQIIQALEAGLLAEVPARGSVGASGDLAPTAHAILALLGEGKCTLPNANKDGFETLPASDALKRIGLQPLVLGPKEGLSLINGTQLTAAMAVQAWREAETLLHTANLSAAMMIEAMRASHIIYDAELVAEQCHASSRFCAEEMASWIGGDTEISQSHAECDRVQDPYSLRCAPQVHGAVWEELMQTQPVLEQELNATTDNPMLFPDSGRVLHGGNFHAIYPARICDRLASAMTTLASISERRIHMAMKEEKSGLPNFLIKEGGLHSGFMMAQTTAAALVSECKSLSFPASVDSISTNNDQEDHVSMGPIAGLKALQIARNLRYVLAIELLSAAQGLDLLAPLKSSPRLEALKRHIREEIPFLDKDRVLAEDMERMAGIIPDLSTLSL